jgi:GNAT superfamily N-acetyltransferase
VSAVRIRPAVLEAAGDIAALALLRRAAASEQGPAPAEDDFGRRFAAWVRAQAAHRTFWLAESRGQDGSARPAGMRLPVGMVGLLRYERLPSPGEPTSTWGYVGNLFVLPDHRDGGTGGALLEAVLDHARGQGMARVVLSPNGVRAGRLFRRAGFRDARELLVHPLDAVEDDPAPDLDELVHPLDQHPLD